MWALSNQIANGNFTPIRHEFTFEINGSESPEIYLNREWAIFGHIFQRKSQQFRNNKLQDIKLVERLFKEYGLDFIHHLTGQFVIIHLESNKFTIYSDHFAIRKFFIYQNASEFIISDDIKSITQKAHLIISKTNLANYAIDYHFTGGTTAFDNVSHNEPGQIIEFKDGKLHYSQYWQPSDLLKLEKKIVPIRSISEALSQAVDTGLRFLDEDRISLSLTGGADTRNLLSIFLSKGIKPHLYTYGNPGSDDCIKAKAISDGLGLMHRIHDIQMTADLFEEYARKIIRQGGGLASIHRAHRLIAVEREREHADYMFLGTLGGEFIKGVSEDDYIVPSIVYENWNNQDFTEEKLLQYLLKKFIRPENLDIHQLLNFIRNEPYMKGDVTTRKHNALSYITAHLHDAQDVNLYKSVMDDVFTPFLDKDYLELIFSSQFTFDQKEKIGNKYLERINNPVYGSNFIRATYPPLLNFLYSGDHKPSEVIFNKYYAAIAKIFRQKTRPKYQPNFPLGLWMEKFVEKHLPLCYDYEILKKTFNLDCLMNEFKYSSHLPKESYWLKYTNPIMMRFILEEYTR